jgi:hypothetical protein
MAFEISRTKVLAMDIVSGIREEFEQRKIYPENDFWYIMEKKVERQIRALFKEGDDEHKKTKGSRIIRQNP